MAKRADQKQKLLYVKKFLTDNTDENNQVSSEDIIDYLAQQGIEAERKSIYSDIKALRDFGVDVQTPREDGSQGYFVGARDFDLAELKLLVDSVQSSKFITERATEKLIKKIESLASKSNAKKLHRQVYVNNRVKTMNGSVFYIIDEISTAINENCMIRFKYYDYTPKKERIKRRNGKYYEVSPYALIWDDENYYLLCFQPDEAKTKHFRVDKITDLQILNRSREGLKELEKINMATYTKGVFGMYSGETKRITMRFADRLAGSVIDRFGKDVMIIPGTDGHFTVTVDIAVSPRYFGWLLGFGADAEIVHPAEVRDELKEFVAKIADIYR